MKDVVRPSLKKFWGGTTNSLRKTAGHIFTDIPESTQQQGFLGIMLLVLFFVQPVSFYLTGLNVTYEQSGISVCKYLEA